MPTPIKTLSLGLLAVLLSATSSASKMTAAASPAQEFIVPAEQLAHYQAIMVDNISMNYLKEPSNNKHRMHRERNYPLSEQRLSKFKQDIEKIVIEAFTKSGRFHKADKPAKGVLKIDITLKDVRITTPTLDQKIHQSSHNYTQTPIHVTLEGEFRDAINNELIAKFNNKRVDTNRFDFFYRSSKSRDDFEMRKIIRHWAHKMQKKMEQSVSMNQLN